jgi:hypothetical protein
MMRVSIIIVSVVRGVNAMYRETTMTTNMDSFLNAIFSTMSWCDSDVLRCELMDDLVLMCLNQKRVWMSSECNSFAFLSRDIL